MRTLLLILTLAASQAFGAVALVQLKDCSGNGGSGTTAAGSCTFDALPAVGNLVVILGGSFNIANGAVSDNQGNVYSIVVKSSYDGSVQGGIYGTLVTVSAGTFTATIASADASIIAEFSGITGPLTVESTGSTFQISPPTTPFLVPCGTGLVATTNDLMFTAFYARSANVQVNSIGSGFPTLVIPTTASYHDPLRMGFSWLAAGPGTYNPDFTLSPNYNMDSGQYVCAAVKQVGAAAAVKIRHRVSQ